MRTALLALGLILAGCAGGARSSERAVFAYVVDLPLDRAAEALDPSFRAVPSGPDFSRAAGGVTETVRLRAYADTLTVALVEAQQRSRSPSLQTRSPFGDGVETGMLPVPGWFECAVEPQWPRRDDTPEMPFGADEVPPVLIGGLEGLAGRLVYPESDRRANRHGSVVVTFIVDTDGSVQCASIVRGSWDGLNREGLRVVRESRFEPGTQRGRPVRVRYTLPIRFALR